MNDTVTDNAIKSRALREAMHLQALESNPLDADQIAMFAMFERETWPHDRRIAYIRARAEAAAGADIPAE